jgi:ABC-type cobalamin transport system ATPase subunit
VCPLIQIAGDSAGEVIDLSGMTLPTAAGKSRLRTSLATNETSRGSASDATMLVSQIQRLDPRRARAARSAQNAAALSSNATSTA